MGGAGSGRWGKHNKKIAVEDCLCLDMKLLNSALAHGSGYNGAVSWFRDRERFAWLGYAIRDSDEGLVLHLEYSKIFQAKKRSVDCIIRVARCSVHFGGIRWYFLCPLIVGGTPCRRRCAKLLLPRRSLYFGCRTCHNLTYSSSQKSG